MAHTSGIRQLQDRLGLNYALLHQALLGLVFLLGAGLRLYQIGAESYWVDEGKLLEVVRTGAQGIVADFASTGRPPVYVWLAYAWTAIFGTSEVATRSLSALFSITSLPLIYLIGAELFGKRVGLLAMFLMAVSELQISQAQNFRYYSLMVLLTLVSYFVYWQALRSGNAWRFGVLALVNLLLFYTHYFGVFVFVAQSLHFVLQSRRYRALWVPWLLSQAAIYAGPAIQLALPFVQRTVIEGGGAPGPAWIVKPRLIELAWTLRHYTLPDAYKISFVPAALLLAGGLLLASVWRGRAALSRALGETLTEARELLSNRSQGLLLLCWFLCPIVLPFILSLVLKPMYITRYTLGASPAFYLLIACILWSGRRLLPTLLAVSVIAVLVGPGLQQYYVQPYNEQWREAVSYVAANAQPDDSVVIAPADEDELWDWYYPGRLELCEQHTNLRNPAVIPDALAQCAAVHRRVWFLWRAGTLPKGSALALTEQLQRGDHPQLQLLTDQEFYLVHVFLLKRAE